MSLNGWISTGYNAVLNWNKPCDKSHCLSPQKTKAVFKVLDEDSKQKFRTCSITGIMKKCGNFLIQTLNLISIIRSGPNFSKMQESVFRKDPLLLKMDFPFFLKIPTFNFANHPSVTEALFKPHRDEDVFLTDNGKNSIYQLIVDMLGDQTITRDDIIFTCSPEMTKLYRSFLNKAFTTTSINEHRKVIHKCAQETLIKWNKMTRESGSVNITIEANTFTCDVLCRLFLGCEDFDGKMAKAMNTFFSYISSRFLKKDFDLQEVENAKNTFWSFIDNAIEKKSIFALNLVENSFDQKQIRMILFSLFFAGTDSTTTSLTYGILKCAQNPIEQEVVMDEIKKLQEIHSSEDFSKLACQAPHVKRILMESIRIFTPVIGILRIAKEDLLLEVINDDETVTRYIPKGELIAPSQNLAARCPMLYPNNPEKYNPYRHQEEEKKDLLSLPWKPFGGGKHVCPGWYVYQLTAQILFAKMMRSHVLSTSIVGEPQQTGHFINKLMETVYVSFLERNE